MNLRRVLWTAILGSLLLLGSNLAPIAPAQAAPAAAQREAATQPDPDSQPASRPRRPRPTSRPTSQLTSRPASRPTTAPASAPAEPPATTLDDCRAQYMRGQYASAEQGYAKLLSQDSTRLAAALGLSEALIAQGKYAQALEALDKVAAPGAADAQWQLHRAEALTQVGEYSKALAAATAADKIQPNYAPTILARGQLLETLGQKPQAVAVYKTMSDVIQLDKYRKDAPSLVALGQILDRDAVLNGKKASQQAQNILQNYFQEAYLKVDPKYWPANIAAGMFALSKQRPDLARAEFELANKLNPRLAEVHVGRATMLLDDYAFEPCMGEVQAALAINPNHPDALMLKAQCLMQWRKFDDVPPVLDAILKVNPNHLDALSLYAAVRIRTFQKDQAQPYIDRVHKINPTCAELPDTIGQWLAAGRQFEDALKFFQEAIQLAPEQADPLTNLGLLYMQTGEEDKAKETLTRASKIDDYRADVINYLNVLDRIEKFQVRQTDHFIIKVNGELDAILLDQVAAYCEQMYNEVCGDFEYHPGERSIIEFFPTHQQFSVRITGKGWIGTVGASTGRVIVMVAPSPDKDRTQFGPYNWSAVIRHEYTHTVTLAKTNNRIPHWFTEACAVWEQPDRRNYEATELLVTAVKANGLFPVKELDWGFIRPKRNGDRSLAYAQSEWIMEYLIATKGFPIINKMLDAFGQGRTQQQIFADLLGASEADFDKAFRAWAKTQVEQWGYDPAPAPDLAMAAAQAKLKPSDAPSQANHAVALYIAGNTKAAETAARAAIAIDSTNKKALAVLASVLMAQKKSDEALTIAQRLEQADHKSKIAPRVLATLAMDKRKWGQAIEALTLLKSRAPLDGWAFEQLANCYINLGQPEQAIPNLVELHLHTMTSPVHARRIADIYHSLDKDEEALKYYQQVVLINPYETGAYQAMASIHLRAKRYDPAIKAARDITILTPTAADAWYNLAKIEFFAGRAKKNVPLLKSAREDASKALKIDAVEQTKTLLERIDETLKESENPPTEPSPSEEPANRLAE